MSKKIKRPKKLQSILCGFAKLICGAGARPNTSMYDLAAEALLKEGVAWPAGMPAKEFTIGNFEYMVGRVLAAKRLAPKVPKEIRIAKKVKASAEFAWSEGFLTSFAWRRVRMQALIKHGRRCQCCGASPADGAVMNVDHVKPRKLFPELALDVDNLQVLCHDCNHGKGNWDQTDWRPASAA